MRLSTRRVTDVRTGARRRSDRRGLTLTELVVVIVLLSIVLGGLMTVVVRQQRFYSGASEIMETRSNVRQMMDILPAELRGLSPAAGDIYAMSGEFIEYRAPTGSAIICAIDPTRTVITVPPTGLETGLTAWLTAPLDGDSLFVYNDSSRAVPNDDVWSLNDLAAQPGFGVCPMATGFTRTAAEEAAGITLTLGTPLSDSVLVGAPIRFFRRSHYELYRASDGQWYLGYFDCVRSATRASACGTLQPVSGPYVPYAASGPSGLRFDYFDSTNTPTADPLRVARITFTARAESRQPLRMSGVAAGGKFQDSVTVDVAVRNRS